jgi:DNA-binding transcriptional LysR family regulator
LIRLAQELSEVSLDPFIFRFEFVHLGLSPLSHHPRDESCSPLSKSITHSDVADEQIIMLDVDEMEQQAVKLLSAFGKRPKVAFRTRSVEAMRSLVATGAGVAVLPDLVDRPWSL